MLERLGVTPEQEKVYLGLIDDPTATAKDLAKLTGIAQVEAELALEQLTEAGLITLTAATNATYSVAPPEPAIQALIHREQQILQKLTAQVPELSNRLQASRQRFDVSSIIEVLVGTSVIADRLEQWQRQTQKCVRLIDRPPFAMGAPQNYTERDMIERGVEYKVLYDADMLQDPYHLKRARECMSWGEQARALNDAPFKILIFDDNAIMMILTHQSLNNEAASVLIHPSELFDSLALLFDQLWQRGNPLNQDSSQDNAPSSFDQPLIELLAAGLKDEAIAIDLDVSVRTVRRRIKALCDELGVRTRFQAGLALRERGLI